MSKRKIEAALRRKGITAEHLEYGQAVTPGELVGCWDIQLSPDSEDAILDADPTFDDFDPDCRNTDEVLEWVASLPDLPAGPALGAGKKEGE